MVVDAPPNPDTACIAVAGSMARICAAAEASGLVAVAELALARRTDGRRHGLDADECDEYTADEVGALLRMSRQAARARLFLALDLLQRRPATLAALTRGDICLTRARRISEALAPVAEDVADGVEQEALRGAREQTPAQLSARLTRLVLPRDPVAAGVDVGRQRGRPLPAPPPPEAPGRLDGAAGRCGWTVTERCGGAPPPARST